MGLIFVDTESDPITKELQSIQVYDGQEVRIYTHNFEDIWQAWDNCSGVVLYNAPYDIGCLSVIAGHRPAYRQQRWRVGLGCWSYDVHRITAYRNYIRPHAHAPPIIDLLKLWSIFVEDTDISLKSLIKRELGMTPIPWSPEAAKTRAYQEQDVLRLADLWYRFLDRVKDIPGLRDYTIADWAGISTPATVTKRAYHDAYPELKAWQKSNFAADDKARLPYALESAYHGGITIALHRGDAANTGWYDIHGAYAHVIQYEHTDRYLQYTWSSRPADTPLGRDRDPVLCLCMTNVMLDNRDNSLQIYRLVEPTGTWLWSYDVLALRLLFGADIQVISQHVPVPKCDIVQSLPAIWSDLRTKEEDVHGKTPLSKYYKFLSNTSYGIKAQRKPYKTEHTNLCIAGIITSRSRLILAEMVDECRKHGCRWLYSDTDSVCVELGGPSDELEDALNARIAPYSCACEAVGTSYILSLKRYFVYDDDMQPIKVRLHGTACYRITQEQLWETFASGGDAPYTPVMLRGLSANTERTYTRILKLRAGQKITNPHPYMFCDPYESDLPYHDWYVKWFAHIDTKTTWMETACADACFARELHLFETRAQAAQFYAKYYKEEYDPDAPDVNWDLSVQYYDNYK